MHRRLHESFGCLLPIQICQENVASSRLTPIFSTTTSQHSKLKPPSFHFAGSHPNFNKFADIGTGDLLQIAALRVRILCLTHRQRGATIRRQPRLCCGGPMSLCQRFPAAETGAARKMPHIFSAENCNLDEILPRVTGPDKTQGDNLSPCFNRLQIKYAFCSRDDLVSRIDIVAFTGG